MATIIQRLARKRPTDENTSKLLPKKAINITRPHVITSRQPLTELNSNANTTTSALLANKVKKSASKIPKLVGQRSNNNVRLPALKTQGNANILAGHHNEGYSSQDLTGLSLTQIGQSLFPQVQIQRSLLEPFSNGGKKESQGQNIFEVEIDRNKIRNIDEKNHDNPAMNTDYVDDIYDNFFIQEVDERIKEDFLLHQDEIPELYRKEMVDWLSELNLKYRLVTDTMFLAINILDRYLAVKVVLKDRLQLVGVASLLIACKYEEIYYPDIAHFVDISANAFSKKEVIEMENEILFTLDWKLSCPTTLTFLRRFWSASGSNATCNTLAKYIIELTLPEYEIVRNLLPSQIAAGAMYLARRMTQPVPFWDETLTHYTRYRERDALFCARSLNEMLHKEYIKTKEDAKAITLKYQNPKYFSVAKIQPIRF